MNNTNKTTSQRVLNVRMRDDEYLALQAASKKTKVPISCLVRDALSKSPVFGYAFEERGISAVEPE